jgi:lipoprotein-anchoring transpeptidase ErfK/SrfK
MDDPLNMRNASISRTASCRVGELHSLRSDLCRVSFLFLLMAFFGACAPQGDARGRNRISVYSTAYLTENNTIAFASRTGKKPEAKPRQDWVWTGDGILGAPAIEIDLTTQSAAFFKGGVEVGKSPISSGREGYTTPTGSFSILQKNKNHVSSLYGDYVDAEGNVVMVNVSSNRDARPKGTTFRGAPMPYFMRIFGGVGMHAGYLPGYPASHGCIRMPRGAAQRFFENAPLGTPVRVIR